MGSLRPWRGFSDPHQGFFNRQNDQSSLSDCVAVVGSSGSSVRVSRSKPLSLLSIEEQANLADESDQQFPGLRFGGRHDVLAEFRHQELELLLLLGVEILPYA